MDFNAQASPISVDSINSYKESLVLYYTFARGSGAGIASAIALTIKNIGEKDRQVGSGFANHVYCSPFDELHDDHGTILEAVRKSNKINDLERQTLLSLMFENGLTSEVAGFHPESHLIP